MDRQWYNTIQNCYRVSLNILFIIFCAFFFNFTAQNWIPTTFEVDNVSSAAPSSDRLGGRIQFKRGREMGGKKEKWGKEKGTTSICFIPEVSLLQPAPSTYKGHRHSHKEWLTFYVTHIQPFICCSPLSRLGGGAKYVETKECYQPSVTSSMAVFSYNSKMSPVTSIPRKTKTKKAIYRENKSLSHVLYNWAYTLFTVQSQIQKQNKKKSTKSARLLAIAPSSISTDQLLEKLRWQSTTHFPGLSVAF